MPNLLRTALAFAGGALIACVFCFLAFATPAAAQVNTGANKTGAWAAAALKTN